MRIFGSKYSQVIAYLFVVVISITGFLQVQHQADVQTADRIKQTKALCEASVVSRQGVRDTIVSTRELGTKLRAKQPPEVRAFAEEVLDRYVNEELTKLPELKCADDGTLSEIP